MNAIKKIGFIGLGKMGFHMAAHLAIKHKQLNVYNRSVEKTTAWMQKFSKISNQIIAYDNLEFFAEYTDVVILCMGDDDSVRKTMHSILPKLKPSTIIIDHTTTSELLAKEMSVLCTAKNINFLDCPVSGGESGAQNGVLTVMAGGNQQAFESIKKVIQAYSKSQNYFGESGRGQVVKMINQILIANILQGLSEGLNIAKQSNLDIELLVNTLKLGAAGSWQLENRGMTMCNNQFNFGFAIDLMLKDLKIVEEFTSKNLLDIKHTSQIKNIYQLLSHAGFGHLDTSALIKQFKE